MLHYNKRLVLDSPHKFCFTRHQFLKTFGPRPTFSLSGGIPSLLLLFQVRGIHIWPHCFVLLAAYTVYTYFNKSQFYCRRHCCDVPQYLQCLLQLLPCPHQCKAQISAAVFLAFLCLLLPQLSILYKKHVADCNLSLAALSF